HALLASLRWGGSAGTDDVGEHAAVDLADLDPNRDRAVCGDGIHQRPEGTPDPACAFGWWRERAAVDGDVQGAGVGDGDDHVRQHDRCRGGFRIGGTTAGHQSPPDARVLVSNREYSAGWS